MNVSLSVVKALTLRHLARPRDAEKIEMIKDKMKSPTFRSVSPIIIFPILSEPLAIDINI